MNSTLYVKRFDSTVVTDVAEDVSLPDYLPEVRRIVGVQANAAVDGKYLSGDEVEADGSVTYIVLYTTGDGSLAQVSQTTSFTGHIPIKSGDDRFSAGDIVLSANLENVNCRVTAPRKLTLSSKVKLSALSERPEDASLRVEKDSLGTPENTVRRRAQDVPTAYMTELRQTGEVSGEIREREGMKLICASGSLCVGDVRCDNSRITVKGDAYLSALMQSPDGGYVISRSRAPIEEEITLPDRQDQQNNDTALSPAAFGKVVLVEVEGADGNFGWKMEYDIDCALIRSATAEITADAYLPDSEDQLTTSEFRILSPACAVNGRLTTSATMELRPDCSFVCAWGIGSADRAEVVGGKTVIGGSVKLSVVTVGGGEFFLDEVTIPLRYECEALAESGSLIGRVQTDVTEINARADGNVLNLTAELAISAAMLAENTKTAAVKLTPTETAKKPKKNMIRVYIPDEGESAWDVEKKFRLGREAVKEGGAYVV